MRGWVSPVMCIKEGTHCMEHWVLYANNESWNTTSKTNNVEYGNKCNIIVIIIIIMIIITQIDSLAESN